MAASKLIYLSQAMITTNDLYYTKILNRKDYKVLVEVWLTEELYKIFEKIMKYDKYSLQYVEHPILGEAAKVKLKQSPHHKIKSIKDIDIAELMGEKEFYIGP
jgi:hypothetical protein